ncbi:OB-fold nucleic acid binding domain-containing protein [Schaalia hyovaginalis]|uniref:RecG-like helicase n=1 Tax=Schaalia hyovaginalis TaxID=29316 RepID=A0A923IWY5_9ACTO|nr:OB-fold nucleic acid binding domain-containing protein [Schaalia hyovaginalis]MBB6334552.1 RecG-like helicase [Schaalia hyovaginalis]MDY2668607.1 OB-fold nucleic acid binding domain-containing protein [Schaalia hyovaginalis]
MSERPDGRLGALRNRIVEHLEEDSRQADEAADEVRSRSRRGTTPICEVRNRQKVTLYGSLLSMTFPPAGAEQVLIATLYDGTGSIELRWPGRRSIPGLSVGEHIEVEGTAGIQGDHLTIINPLYRIITTEGS